MILTKYSGLVLDVAKQRGGAEPGTATLLDRSRYGNDGAMTNAPTWVQLPSGLWVLDFTAASSQYIDFGASSSINKIQFAVTVEFWINFKTLGDYQRIFNTGAAFGAANVGVEIVKDNADTIYFIVEGSITEAAELQANIIADNWYYFTGTNTGAIGILYMDAVEVDRDTVAVGDFSSVGNNTYIGRRPTAVTQLLNGYIGMLNVYNYALTPAQVRARYSATRRLFGV